MIRQCIKPHHRNETEEETLGGVSQNILDGVPFIINLIKNHHIKGQRYDNHRQQSQIIFPLE